MIAIFRDTNVGHIFFSDQLTDIVRLVEKVTDMILEKEEWLCKMLLQLKQEAKTCKIEAIRLAHVNRTETGKGVKPIKRVVEKKQTNKYGGY